MPEGINDDLTSPIENLPDLSFEIGPELGSMTLEEANIKLQELNKDLNDSEKWSIPTYEQWLELIKPTLKSPDKELLLSKIREKYNLKPATYWSSTKVEKDKWPNWPGLNDKYHAVGIDMSEAVFVPLGLGVDEKMIVYVR